MNCSELPEENDKFKFTKAQNLLKRIRELEEICTASLPHLSTEIPVGYTPARWQLALQSFNERLTDLKSRNYFNSHSQSSMMDGDEADFDIEMGPEWELKCAQKELEELLNQ